MRTALSEFFIDCMDLLIISCPRRSHDTQIMSVAVFLARLCCPCASVVRWYRDSRLRRLAPETARRWVAPIRRAKVIDVYDGDTVTLAAFVSGHPFKFRCRLARIDAPEMRPDPHKSKAGISVEKRAARIARDALADMALNRLVTVRDVRNEKWGRVLADLVVDGTTTTLSDRMLELGMAVPYGGGKKVSWDWSKFPVRQRNSIIRRHRE